MRISKSKWADWYDMGAVTLIWYKGKPWDRPRIVNYYNLIFTLGKVDIIVGRV